MHIVGMLDEAHGGDFYAVKTPGGEVSDLKGYVNVSERGMRSNTISFTVHKNALPADLLKRLGIVPEPTLDHRHDDPPHHADNDQQSRIHCFAGQDSTQGRQ